MKALIACNSTYKLKVCSIRILPHFWMCKCPSFLYKKESFHVFFVVLEGPYAKFTFRRSRVAPSCHAALVPSPCKAFYKQWTMFHQGRSIPFGNIAVVRNVDRTVAQHHLGTYDINLSCRNILSGRNILRMALCEMKGLVSLLAHECVASVKFVRGTMLK